MDESNSILLKRCKEYVPCLTELYGKAKYGKIYLKKEFISIQLIIYILA
jgi:hypothetical protein